MNIRVEEIRKLQRGSLRGFATVNIVTFFLLMESHFRESLPIFQNDQSV